MDVRPDADARVVMTAADKEPWRNESPAVKAAGVWPPADGKPYMPANGTEGEMFIEEWCADCALDDDENQEYCEILSNSFFGVQPKEWTWRGGCGHCSAFVPFDPDRAKPEPRCPYTIEMFE